MQSIPSVGWWRPETNWRVETPVGVAFDRTPIGLAFGSLLVFTVVLVASPQDFVPGLGMLRPALLTAVIAGVTCLWDLWRRADAHEPMRREVVLAGLLFAWAVVTIPLSMWPTGSITVLVSLYAKALVVFWLIGRVVDSVERLRLLLWTLAIATVPLALTGIHHYLTGEFMPDARGRIQGYGQGLASNPNDLALMLDIVIPFTVALLFGAHRRLAKLGALAILALDAVAVLATYSRGGFLTLAAVALCCAVWLIKERRAVVLVYVLAVGALAVPLLPASYVGRLQTMTDINSDPTGSAQDRYRDTVLAVGFVEAHPLVGAGLGMDYLALNDLRAHTWRSVHNAYLNYGVDLGMPGLVLFVSLFAASVWTARSTERAARASEGSERAADLATFARGTSIALFGFAVAGFFYPVAYNFYFYYLGGLAVALGTITRREGKRERH